MIFVCTGTQVYQFDRLLKKIDELVKNKVINEDIFAQIGSSKYKPKYFAYKRFLSSDEFDKWQNRADLIISHAGTGALIGASKKGKNIIAVPRLSKYGEHIDDHQLQIASILEQEGYVRTVYDMNNLSKIINEALNNPISKIYSRESYILDIIDEFISKN